MPPIAAIAHTAPNRSEMISADGLYHVAYKSSIADARHGSFGPGRMSRIVENVRVLLRPPGLQVPLDNLSLLHGEIGSMFDCHRRYIQKASLMYCAVSIGHRFISILRSALSIMLQPSGLYGASD